MIDVSTGKCPECGQEGTLVKEQVDDHPDDWMMLCEDCASYPWFSDPMDWSLEEVLSYFSATQTASKLDNPRSRDLLVFVFSKMHPVEAGSLLDLIAEGVDHGPAQGTYHPNFQGHVRMLVKDPEDRFNR